MIYFVTIFFFHFCKVLKPSISYFQDGCWRHPTSQLLSTFRIHFVYLLHAKYCVYFSAKFFRFFSKYSGIQHSPLSTYLWSYGMNRNSMNQKIAYKIWNDRIAVERRDNENYTDLFRCFQATYLLRWLDSSFIFLCLHFVFAPYKLAMICLYVFLHVNWTSFLWVRCLVHFIRLVST